ncbi:YjbH domain-containing protein, partial [Gammaproteobacteria bacterium]|nr:YjbH domain-containing protein [Gammaproteobacteria bacterium]
TAVPFDWFEANYRYSEIKNKKYGPSAYSGNQSLKDKGFDIKIRLIKEKYYFPEIAIGIRDLAGTGIFSSEYLVSTKRLGNFDLSLGLGWGLLGKESGISNPLESLSKEFLTREIEVGEGGEFSYKQWFSGDTSILGGIEYDLNKYGLRFKLEYDTTELDKFPSASSSLLEIDSRFNFGLTYFYKNFINFSASLERGNQFRLGFNIKANFLEDKLKKPRPKNVVRLNDEQKKKGLEDKDIFYRSLNKSLQDESIYIQAANYNDKDIDIAIASSKFFSFTRAAGRTARVTEALSSDNIERINIHSMNGDIEVATFSLDRKGLANALNFKISSTELLNKSSIESNSSNPLYKRAQFVPRVNFPEIEWNMSPSIRHQIGGPEGFYLGQLSWQTDLSIKFKRNLSLYSSLGINIYDTFDGLKNPSQSSIPHVRSDIQQYLDQGKNHIKRLQLEYLYSPIQNVFFRGDLGYFEEMFGGFGGEILYRPFNKSYALGLSSHKVYQRDYNQRLGFLDYSNITSHISLYRQFPSGVLAKLSSGEYLAGDKGSTLDISRRFKTGFTLGIFATFTNLSKEEFGEGSFDKGFYFSIPTKLFYPDYRSGSISFGLHPLTKDGGAILNHHHTLYGIVGDTGLNSIERDWNYFLN